MPVIDRSRTTRLAAGICVAALTLAGCAGTNKNEAGTGPGAAPGFDPKTKTITVGALFPLSGFFANTNQDVIGMQAYFHRVTGDTASPLHGYKIKIESPDTHYEPQVTIPLYQQMKGKVALISGILGANITSALLPSLKADGVVAVAATDSTYLRSPNIVPALQPYQVMTANAVSYLAKEKGLAKASFCSVVQDGAIGTTMQKGVDHAVGKLGLKWGTKASYAFGTTDFTAQVTTLKNAGCGAVAILGTGTVVQGLAVRAAQLGYTPTWVAMGPSYSQDIATGAGSDYIREHVLMAFTGGAWDASDPKGQEMLRADVAAVAPKAVAAAVTYQTGYVYAIAAAKVLAKGVQDGDLSRKHLLEIAQSGLGTIDNYGLGGGEYVYGSSVAERNPPRRTSVFAIDNKVPGALRAVAVNYTSDAGTSVPVD